MDPQRKTDRFTKVYLALWGICILVALFAIVLYKFGFRLSNNFEPVKVSSIELSSNESGLQFFWDNKNAQVPFRDNMYRIQNVTPGLHSLLVYKDGFWPWTKNINTPANATQLVFAFIFPMQGLKTTQVDSNSAEYAERISTINKNVLPQPKIHSEPSAGESYVHWLLTAIPNYKVSADKSTALFSESDTIYLGWISQSEPPPHYFCIENPCTFQLPVTVSVEPIKNVDFYKGRRDVVLFSAGAAIYAIEADRQGTQNFQPVYKGKNPYFYETADGSLYIKDGGSLLRATL